MISIELNRELSTPLYIQLFEQISHKIHNGVIKSGTKLPSQRELASQLGISVNTIVNAYNMLVQYEYVTSTNRSGYYVNELIHAETSQPDRRWHSNSPLTYNFSRNGVDLKMNGEFKKALRQTAKLFTDGDFTYPDYTGEYELRKQICLMLNKYYEINCNPTQVVIGAGINYLLDSLIKVIGIDKVYGFENPAYYKISDFMRLGAYNTAYLNVSTDGVTLKELKDFDADAIFLMPYHHYPLSSTLSADQKKSVLDWAGTDRYIIEYGLDMEFVYSSLSKPMFSMTENKNVIFMSDFSKTISPGLNLAYLVLPEPLVKRWQEVYLYFHSYGSKFEQNFISEIIKNGSYYRNVKRLKKLYNTKRHFLISAIENHPVGDKIEIKNSKAGTFLLIEPKTTCDFEKLIDECHKAGVKLSYIKNALEQPNDLISPRTYILGFGELSESEIKNGINLLLDTWGKMMDNADKNIKNNLILPN